MIRMGRSNKLEQPSETPKFQENYSNNSGNLYATRQENQPQSTSNRSAVSESKFIGRDIKEGRLSGFVGSGTTLTGETSFKATLRVDGHLTGTVLSDTGTLIVGTGGQVDANITVAAAIIHGIVKGDVVATERVELGRTAKLVGNIQTPSLSIEQGAIFEGNCNMIRQKAEMDKRAAQSAQAENYSHGYEAAESPNGIAVEEKIVTKNAA